MAPRFQTLRPAQTASAREAMRSFFCDLCQKGYSRMNEYEAHLSSYDHSHKQRLKDMKAMVRDPAVTARARRQEAKATDAVISIKLGAGGSTAGSGGVPSDSGAGDGNNGTGLRKGGFRKGGFRSAFVAADGSGSGPASASASAAAAAAPMTNDPLRANTGIGQPLPAIALPALSGPSLPTASTMSSLPPPLPLVGASQTKHAPAKNGTPYESDTEDEGYELYDPFKPTG